MHAILHQTFKKDFTKSFFVFVHVIITALDWHKINNGQYLKISVSLLFKLFFVTWDCSRHNGNRYRGLK